MMPRRPDGGKQRQPCGAVGDAPSVRRLERFSIDQSADTDD